MKTAILLILLIGLATAELFRGKPDWDDDWKQFKGRHGKDYKDPGEESKRRKLWEESRDIVNKHNAEAAEGKHTFKMGDNHLSDMTEEEKQHLTKTQLPPSRDPRSSAIDSSYPAERQLPSSVDLRTDPCLPGVKDQKQCGSCWAFAGNTPLEYRLCKKTGVLKTLSEQQMVDCTLSVGNHGCSGGFYTTSWDYIKSNGGQACSAAYPYTATVRNCSFTTAMSVGSSSGYSYLAATETAIRTAVASGPVAAVIQALSSFQRYSSGVYSDPLCPYDGKTVNHAVVIVGYGSENGVNHWIVRNSWGTGWGLQGYILVKRGVNMCNIETAWNAVPNV